MRMPPDYVLSEDRPTAWPTGHDPGRWRAAHPQRSPASARGLPGTDPAVADGSSTGGQHRPVAALHRLAPRRRGWGAGWCAPPTCVLRRFHDPPVDAGDRRVGLVGRGHECAGRCRPGGGRRFTHGGRDASRTGVGLGGQWVRSTRKRHHDEPDRTGAGPGPDRRDRRRRGQQPHARAEERRYGVGLGLQRPRATRRRHDHAATDRGSGRRAERRDRHRGGQVPLSRVAGRWERVDLGLEQRRSAWQWDTGVIVAARVHRRRRDGNGDWCGAGPHARGTRGRNGMGVGAQLVRTTGRQLDDAALGARGDDRCHECGVGRGRGAALARPARQRLGRRLRAEHRRPTRRRNDDSAEDRRPGLRAHERGGHRGRHLAFAGGALGRHALGVGLQRERTARGRNDDQPRASDRPDPVRPWDGRGRFPHRRRQPDRDRANVGEQRGWATWRRDDDQSQLANGDQRRRLRLVGVDARVQRGDGHLHGVPDGDDHRRNGRR